MPALWRLTWSHACGVYWQHCRAVTPETAEHWKRVFEGDDCPNAFYQIAEKKPPMPRDADALARHAATL